MKPNVLISGGSGYIGKHLIHTLKDIGNLYAITKYEEDMTEEGYASFTGTAFYEIPAKAYEAHKELDLENLNIQKEEDSYDISGKLTLESEEGTQSMDIQGTAQTDDQGLVSYLNISNISEIIESLES